MKITPEEIDNVSRLSPFDRYHYFIKRVADFGILYTLADEEGNLAVSEIDDKILLSFWSAKEYALLNITNEWEQYLVKEITLEEFEARYIDFVIDNRYLLNVFPINNKTGFVVDVSELARDLADEM